MYLLSADFFKGIKGVRASNSFLKCNKLYATNIIYYIFFFFNNISPLKILMGAFKLLEKNQIIVV